MRSMSIVAVRASLASVSSRVDDRRMNESIPSHPFDAHACMHSRARWAWTTMYTHSDSIHSHTKHRCIRFVPHRPCMFYKTCMNDRFVPRIETQYVHTPPWSGSVDTHDGRPVGPSDDTDDAATRTSVSGCSGSLLFSLAFRTLPRGSSTTGASMRRRLTRWGMAARSHSRRA